ncbi:MAG: ABC transporter substrate-binding protein [Proteobacteria bacterium]|nr:ABC transporter substrate-binding protein [Pseudomonadota bacterium]
MRGTKDRGNRSPSLAVLSLALSLAAAPAAFADSVIRYVPDADLRVLDPIFTTAGTTLNHGYMIYDFLLAPDAKMDPRPQMLESYEASPDGLVYRFKLRPGMKWHDGTPVEAKDAVASLKRWGIKVPAGQDPFQHVSDVVATGPLAFEIRMKDRFAPLIASVTEPINPPFIMREKDALTDPNTAFTEAVGSGPFAFVKEEWVPGSKVVYRKNAAYVPRSEPAEHLAGGKVVKVDRVEWRILPDANTAAQALGSGEVDYLENPNIDLLATLRGNPNVVIQVVNPLGYQMIMRPNHLIQPFNNPKVRQALLYAVDQDAYLTAAVGDASLRKPCWAIFICGSPLETKIGLGDWTAAGAKRDKARQLLKEAGYANEPVVVMVPTDQTVIGAISQMTVQTLKEVGFNVEAQSMDWSTLISRRPIKDSPATNRGGWNIFHTTGFAMSLSNPVGNSFVATPCDGKNWFGWPCDDELDRIRRSFVDAETNEARRAIAERFQARFYESVPLVPLGQYVQPVAYRSNLSGVLLGSRIVLWNVEKR